jgi:hypothetical protein
MPAAPALTYLCSLLAKADSYEDITVPVTDDYSKLVVNEDTTCASITDSYFSGERRIIIRGDDLTVIARRGLTIFPTPPYREASTRSIYLQAHPITYVERDTPFTAAQRQHLEAAGFTLTSRTKAARNA